METYTAETLMANVMKLMKIVREKECTCSFWWDELEHFDFWHPRQPHLVSRIQDPLPTNTQTGLFETSMCWHLSTIIIAGQSPSPRSCHQHTPLPYYLYCYTLIYDNTQCQHVFFKHRTQEENDNINNTSLEALCFPINSTKLKAYAYHWQCTSRTAALRDGRGWLNFAELVHPPSVILNKCLIWNS